MARLATLPCTDEIHEPSVKVHTADPGTPASIPAPVKHVFFTNDRLSIIELRKHISYLKIIPALFQRKSKFTISFDFQTDRLKYLYPYIQKPCS